jgi:hypothetical protein
MSVRVDELECGRVAVVGNNLQLHLGLALRTDLLGSDVGVGVLDAERALPRLLHPSQPGSHQVECAVILLMTNIWHLQQSQQPISY